LQYARSVVHFVDTNGVPGSSIRETLLLYFQFSRSRAVPGCPRKKSRHDALVIRQIRRGASTNAHLISAGVQDRILLLRFEQEQTEETERKCPIHVTVTAAVTTRKTSSTVTDAIIRFNSSSVPLIGCPS